MARARAGSQASALEAGLWALRQRDLSGEQLRARLEAKAFSAQECEDALETLARTGVLDDERFAEGRARSLAGRGAGDALVRHDLQRAGVGSSTVERVVSLLEPEEKRARAIVERRGAGARTARYLGAKGFSEDAIGAAVATSWRDALG